MAAKLDLLIDKGATFRHTLKWRTRDSLGVISDVDLSGFTGRMKIRNTRTDADPPLAELTTANFGIVLEAGGETGRIDLFIADTDTEAYTWETGVYDLELIDAGGSGDVKRLVQGRVAVDQEVTT
ncbi:MAG: hypothetical protein GY896_23035 [Gammaproteobacteria bacterium]|nr:hypothetical protein [Gammaproteobacteria bacterium]